MGRVEERLRRRLDQFINGGIPAVVGLLIDRAAAQVQNPRLYAALWDQVRNGLLSHAVRLSVLPERLCELTCTCLDLFGIGVKNHDQCSASSAGASAERPYGRRVPVTHPLFSAAPSAGQWLKSDLVGPELQTIQILSDKTLVSRVLREDDDL